MTLINAQNFPLNCGTVSNNPHYIYSKTNIDKEFELVLSKTNRILNQGTSSTPIVSGDMNLSSSINASYVEDILASINGKGYFDYIEYEALNSTITKSGDNAFSYEQNGTAIIKATNIYGFSQLAKIDIKSFNPTTIYNFISWVNGSLSKHINDNMVNILSSANSNNNNLFLNNVTGTPTTYTRNTNLWMSNIDFTCFSPWNSTGQNTMAGTLISKKHVIFCKHLSFYPKQNATIKFVTNDNQIITRTLTKITPMGDLNAFAPDITIGTLNEEMPDSIKVVPIFPSNYKDYIFSLKKMFTPFSLIGAITMHQDKKIGLASIRYLVDSLNGASFTLGSPSPFGYSSFGKAVVEGDSGSPVFTLINNNLVLIGVFTGSGGGGMPTQYISEINAIMAIDGPYSLTTVDLSSFNPY